MPAPEILNRDKQEGGRGYEFIEMEYIEGDTLLAEWDTLSNEASLETANPLRDIIKTLYAIPPPISFIGAYNSDRLLTRAAWTPLAAQHARRKRSSMRSSRRT